MAALAIPMVFLGKPFFAVSLALGALAGALSETDDHPKGRLSSMLLKVFAFGVSSLSVALLHPYPVLLGIGLSLSTIFYLLIGGLNERYRGITFGTILVGIYAMIGASSSPAWYWQPLLLPLGALCYNLLSLGLLFLHPWRPLEEQLARGYLALASYVRLKATLFPSSEAVQAKLRTRLALENVKVVAALDQCRDVLNSYRESLSGDEPLIPYLRRFMLLQSLHERAASSHERYDLLSSDPANREILEGIGQVLRQLGEALEQFARSLLTREPYAHPVSLEWILSALRDRLAQGALAGNESLNHLVTNLNRSHKSLLNLGDDTLRAMGPRLARDARSLTRRFLDQLHWGNPRLRHAMRLSLCFLAGVAISESFQLHKGAWIVLTSLFVLQPNYSTTRRRLHQRVIGTLSGVVGGVLLVQLLPTVPGELLFMLCSAFFFFFWLKRNYSISVIFITTFVLCAFNLVSQQGVALMLPRIIDTLIGSGLAFLSVRLLWPDWQHKRLPGLIHTALRRNTDYLAAILNENQRDPSAAAPQDGDDFNYRVARRAAHRADNALALAWQDMQLEPRRTREGLDQSFQLTYLNHALLSYISALGAHRQANTRSQQTPCHACALHAALEEILSPDKQGDLEKLSALVHQLREELLEAPAGYARLELTLLCNIADLTRQIMSLSPSVNRTAAA